MSDYRAPLAQMRFTIEHLGGLAEVAGLPDYQHATPDLVEAVLEEAGKFAEAELATINWLGDRAGVRVVDDAVQVPAEFSAAYAKFREAGWPGIAANPEYGGQGLPKLVSLACDEMWNSANMSFALCPDLSQGALLAIERHGAESEKQAYLGRLVSGEWTGTMCLTEPQSGSDLSGITTRAEPCGDHWKLSGRKIYITWGDHPMTPNIVHLVLARTPGAPQGTKGISLFVAPKFLLDEQGEPGLRNDVRPVSVEHKLGIHASPTCVLAFGDHGGAEAWLVGKENEGLAAMFTMMNYMRLGVGAQGVGIGERAYQKAVAYARERVQGRAPGERGKVTIIRHPDVRRMLLQMRAQNQAGRALCYYTGACLDRGAHGSDSAEVARWQARGELLTPIAKAWCTEVAQEVTSLALQVHGGMGYVEETGIAQCFRDARIASIYEGTNGIQAIDLVGRKLLRDGGATVAEFVSDMRAVDAPLANAGERLASVRKALARALDELVEASSTILSGDKRDPELASGVAYDYLMLAGTAIGGWQLARGALAALEQLEGSTDKGFLETQLVLAQFYAEHLLPRCTAHAAAVRAGSGSLMALAAEQF
jgi:alkylation response protein AidB-like acyl-CoA dehydrogenase